MVSFLVAWRKGAVLHSLETEVSGGGGVVVWFSFKSVMLRFGIEDRANAALALMKANIQSFPESGKHAREAEHEKFPGKPLLT